MCCCDGYVCFAPQLARLLPPQRRSGLWCSLWQLRVCCWCGFLVVSKQCIRLHSCCRTGGGFHLHASPTAAATLQQMWCSNCVCCAELWSMLVSVLPPSAACTLRAPTVPLRPVVFSWPVCTCCWCGFLVTCVVCVAIAKWSQGAAFVSPSTPSCSTAGA